MGETSGSVIRALSLGKPLLVSDVGWFSELPDDAVLKVPVDEHEVRVIAAALGVAADHGASLGAAARAYVEREHALPTGRRRLRRSARGGRRRRRGERRGALAHRRGGGGGGDRRRTGPGPSRRRRGNRRVSLWNVRGTSVREAATRRSAP